MITHKNDTNINVEIKNGYVLALKYENVGIFTINIRHGGHGFWIGFLEGQ
jgi:frataxin-like iron-binding protein CyaY